MLSILIIVIKPIRTPNNAQSKIRKPKPKFHLAVDNENKKFLNFNPISIDSENPKHQPSQNVEK